MRSAAVADAGALAANPRRREVGGNLRGHLSLKRFSARWHRGDLPF
jgi:hypothetical protein